MMRSELHQSREFLNKLAWKYAKNHDDAKDLTQETVCIALEKANYFKSGTNFKAWISIVMRNIFINRYRKNRKRNLVPIENIVNLSDSYHIEPTAVYNLITEEVKTALAKLEAKNQEVLQLCLKGHSYKETAKILDLPIGTVKSRIHLARKKLKIELQRINII
jgi:RNA polymerase sigma factor (sigma-70 family)